MQFLRLLHESLYQLLCRRALSENQVSLISERRLCHSVPKPCIVNNRPTKLSEHRHTIFEISPNLGAASCSSEEAQQVPSVELYVMLVDEEYASGSLAQSQVWAGLWVRT